MIHRLAAMLALTACFAGAQSTNNERTIAASGTARTEVRADTAILFLVVRSTAPVAAEALAQNQAKDREIEKAAATLGLRDKARLTGSRIASATPANYGPSPQTLSGYEASQYLYVFFEAADFKDRDAFDRRVAGAIDEFRKAGAAVYDRPVNRVCQGQSPCSVAFAIRDHAAMIKGLLPEALRNARTSAEQAAQVAGVQLGALRSVGVGCCPNQYGMMAQGGPLEDLYFDDLSGSETMTVTLTVSAQYDIR
jgi:uncharacterized protein YggE